MYQSRANVMFDTKTTNETGKKKTQNKTKLTAFYLEMVYRTII